MADLIGALRDEIRKQARKEMRASTERTKKLVATHRREIAELKKQLTDAQKRIAFLESCERKRLADAKPAKATPKKTLRFSSKSVRSHRERLGLSAEEYGMLLGVSSKVIYQWEKGSKRPPKEKLIALAELREIGKKEARERLRLIKLQAE